MQEILFYRELDFPLKGIQEILSSHEYDKYKALKAQKNLLTLKKERLERLIDALEGVMKGEKISMNVFDNGEFEKQRDSYAKEVKEKWGDTAEYREYSEKKHSAEKQSELIYGMDALMDEFASCMADGHASESEEAQSLVKKLQAYITENFYTCTKEILSGLGEMYTADERFKANIDKHSEGTAGFIHAAIRAYCG
jgi:DNA-binding transcriptional MerR regulator